MILYNYLDHIKIYPVGMFLGKKNNSILTTILKYINIFYNKSNYQCLGATMFQNIFNNYNKNDKLKTIFNEIKLKELYIDNANCYLKVKWNQLDIFYKNQNVDTKLFEQDDTIFGIHWFNGADVSKEYCNNLDLDLLKNNEPKCLIDKFLKQYI